MCRQWRQLVEEMSTGARVKMIWMDTTALQEQLRSTLQRALGVLCMVLEVACHERLIATLARLQKVIKAMSAKPVSLAQFTVFVRELKDMQASQGEVLADVDVITVRSPHFPELHAVVFSLMCSYAYMVQHRIHIRKHAFQEFWKPYQHSLIFRPCFLGLQALPGSSECDRC